MSTLSIIIPVFNVEKYLRQCLDSVLVDNGFRGQVLCVNDGSTDGSAAILDKYAKKYPNIEIITQRNAGLSVARNVGFDRATGEYVLFLDSDDWVLPNSLEKLRKHINNEDTIYFNTITYEDETSTYGDRTDIKEYAHISGSESFAITSYTYRSVPFVTVCGKLYKRSFLKENHLYNEPDIYHEDNYFTPQVHLWARDVSCVNEYVYVYRIRKGSITGHITQKHIKDAMFILRQLVVKYSTFETIEKVFYLYLVDEYIDTIKEAYKAHISLLGIWTYSDSKSFLQLSETSWQRRVAKLSFISPYVAYKYMQNEFPTLVRRLVNKFL